jgi:APA family basic amino acid/polyamine antiporter
VTVLAGALTFGELAARYPQSGGLYVYLREAFGTRLAFLYGWQSLLIMDPGVTAALAAGGSEYIVLLWPPAAVAGRWLAVGLIWALALLNIAGVRFGTRVFGLLTALKIATLGAVVCGAFVVGIGDWSHFATTAGPRTGAPIGQAVAVALVGAFFSFGGFWETSRIAGEVRDPRRTVPRALVLGVLGVTAIYMATTAAFIYLVPPSAATSASAFAREAGNALMGSAGPQVFAAVVTLSVVASAMAMLMVSPRLYEAMSLDGLFPAAVAARHPVLGTPVRATALLATLASVLVLLGTFDQIVAFFVCTALGFVALAAAAVFVVRRRRADAPAFRVPGYPLTPVVFLLLVGAVMSLVAITRPVQAFAGLALVLLGVPLSTRLAPARAARLAEGED